MTLKRVLGLSLCAAPLAAIVWGRVFAKMDRMVSIKAGLIGGLERPR